MEINLRINDQTLQPGEHVDPEVLKSSKFRQPGLMSRLVNRLPRGQVLLETEECTVDCFDERLSLFPCTHSYLNRDRQWNTRASVLLVDGLIKKVSFQIVGGVYAAPNFMDKFKSICTEICGDPERKQRNHYLWKNGQLGFSGFLHPDHINADFSIECLED